MAASALPAPASIEKRRLKDTPMYVNRIEETAHLILNIVKWTVCSFRKLKKAIRYKTDIPQLNWCLSLYKDRQSLFINVVPKECHIIIECFMLHTPSASIHIKRTGRYEYQIPFSDIENPDNKFFYDEDKLHLHFRYRKGQPISGIRPFISARCDREMCELINELWDSNGKNFEPNFSIRLYDGHVDFRKDILAARCKFFYNYLKQNPNSTEYQISTTTELMQRLRNYIMFGCTGEPIDLGQKLDVFMLAVFLNIPILQYRLDMMLEDIVNAGNVHKLAIAEGRVKGGKELRDSLSVFLTEKKNRTSTEMENVERNLT